MSGEHYSIDLDLFGEFVDETLESLQPLECELLELEKGSTDPKLIDRIFRPIHSLKGSVAFFGMIKSQQLIHQMENVLDRLRKGKMQVDSTVINLLLQGLDFLKIVFTKALPGQEAIHDMNAFDDLCHKLDSIKKQKKEAAEDILNDLLPLLAELYSSLPPDKQTLIDKALTYCHENAVEEEVLASAVKASEVGVAGETVELQENTEPSSSSLEQDKTMRISERKLEAFFEHVGELIIVSEMFRHVGLEMAALPYCEGLEKNFKQVLTTYDALTGNLQESVLAIKKVPVKNMLQKVPRLVKETSGKIGKVINVELIGEHHTIDKSYIELLDAPLTHMIRNAVDHGIEDPVRRKGLGKSEVGNIKVDVDLDEENIQLKISDDGSGLNMERIRDKAVSSGIVSAEETLSHEKLLDFLFQPGFSTAEKVTDISGRGVGMDVVKQKIQSAGGRIDVVNRPGRGVDFTITLPQVIETQIMTGFLIQARGETYVFEMENVRESFCITKSDVTAVTAAERVIPRYDDFLSLYDLGAILKSESFSDRALTGERISVIAVEVEGKLNAFMVDEILGVRKVVVKAPPHYISNSGYYAGTAIMGDGSVAMVLNGEGLINSVEVSNS